MKSPKELEKEAKATPKDEAEESPEEQKEEAEEGEEMHGDVKIPEEFQTQVGALVYACDNDEKLEYIQTCVRKKQDELREQKMNAKAPKGKKVPGEFSLSQAPSY